MNDISGCNKERTEKKKKITINNNGIVFSLNILGTDSEPVSKVFAQYIIPPQNKQFLELTLRKYACLNILCIVFIHK